MKFLVSSCFAFRNFLSVSGRRPSAPTPTEMQSETEEDTGSSSDTMVYDDGDDTPLRTIESPAAFTFPPPMLQSTRVESIWPLRPFVPPNSGVFLEFGINGATEEGQTLGSVIITPTKETREYLPDGSNIVYYHGFRPHIREYEDRHVGVVDGLLRRSETRFVTQFRTITSLNLAERPMLWIDARMRAQSNVELYYWLCTGVAQSLSPIPRWEVVLQEVRNLLAEIDRDPTNGRTRYNVDRRLVDRRYRPNFLLRWLIAMHVGRDGGPRAFVTTSKLDEEASAAFRMCLADYLPPNTSVDNRPTRSTFYCSNARLAPMYKLVAPYQMSDVWRAALAAVDSNNFDALFAVGNMLRIAIEIPDKGYIVWFDPPS